jgi:hypothetical protein
MSGYFSIDKLSQEKWQDVNTPRAIPTVMKPLQESILRKIRFGRKVFEQI